MGTSIAVNMRQLLGMIWYENFKFQKHFIIEATKREAKEK